MRSFCVSLFIFLMLVSSPKAQDDPLFTQWESSKKETYIDGISSNTLYKFCTSRNDRDVAFCYGYINGMIDGRRDIEDEEYPIDINVCFRDFEDFEEARKSFVTAVDTSSLVKFFGHDYADSSLWWALDASNQFPCVQGFLDDAQSMYLSVEDAGDVNKVSAALNRIEADYHSGSLSEEDFENQVSIIKKMIDFVDKP